MYYFFYKQEKKKDNLATERWSLLNLNENRSSYHSLGIVLLVLNLVTQELTAVVRVLATAVATSRMLLHVLCNLRFIFCKKYAW